jgi:imidazolonepropionase-like amidohydrolase
MKAITGVRLIDGTGSKPIDNATVVISGDKIEAVGAEREISIPPEAEVISASGMSLLPGLIDCHDHIASFGYDVAGRWVLNEHRSTRHMRIAAVLRQTLESGYTTVRDAGGLDAGFRQAVDEGLIPGPRLQVSLSIITPTGGVGEDTSASGYRNPSSPNPSLPSGVANGPDGMRVKVREMVKAGADVIKFATTGGASSRPGLGPKDMVIGSDEIEALVQEAHHLGRRVMCHALGGPGLRKAIEAGVDSIEHGAYLDEDPDLLKIMAQKGIFLTPTFSVYVYHGEFGTPHGRIRAAEMKEHHIKSVQMALEAGVKVVTGTDAGGWVHGNNAQEITCLTRAGMTPAQAILSATGHASECIGLDSEIGTITPGKKADLILVEGNPLEDVAILETGASIKFVMKDSQIYVDKIR